MDLRNRIENPLTISCPIPRAAKVENTRAKSGKPNMKTEIYLKAEQHFTTAGEQSGALAAALKAESTADLQTAYLYHVQSPHWANPVFGGNFKRWMNFLARELHARGIEAIRADDFFGPRTVNIRITS